MQRWEIVGRKRVVRAVRRAGVVVGLGCTFLGVRGCEIVGSLGNSIGIVLEHTWGKVGRGEDSFGAH